MDFKVIFYNSDVKSNERTFSSHADLSKGVPLGSHNSIQYGKPDNCIKGSRSNVVPVLFFMVAQLLLGAGGSPLFTLGTTYIDDHVKRESSSMYIGQCWDWQMEY